MTAAEFDIQLDRLKSQWPNAYGPERKLRIWEVMGSTSGQDFKAIVDLALDTMRGAPLNDDFLRLAQEMRERRAGERAYSGIRAMTVGETVERAARANKTADPEFVKACVKLLRSKLDGQLAMPQFLQGCDLLDRAGPQFAYAGRDRQIPRED